MGSYCCHAKHNSVNTQAGDKVDDENNIYIKTRAEASPYKKLKTEVISFKCGLKDLELRQTKFYKEKIGMSPSDLVKTRKIYNELGQYPFDGEDYIEDFGEDIAKNPKGRNWIYIGQFKAGTKIASGIGICVWDTGATLFHN